MSAKPSFRMIDKSIVLPSEVEPLGAYTQARKEANLVFVTGQLAFSDGAIVNPGTLGIDVTAEEGAGSARVAALNAVASASTVAGGVDNLTGVLQVVGYFACCPKFAELSKVMDGASEVLVEIFGDKGIHTRSTVGVSVLPAKSPVEIQVTFAAHSRENEKGASCD